MPAAFFETRNDGTVDITASEVRVPDNVFTIIDNEDQTRKLRFSLGSLSPGTTRTITVPDASFTLVNPGVAQTWTGVQTFAGNIVPDGDNTTRDIGTAALRWRTGYFGTSVKIGVTAGSQLLNVQGTVGNQVAVLYDGSNYMLLDVSSAGLVTFNAVGASQGFAFSDPVSIAGFTDITAGGVRISGDPTVPGVNTTSIAAALTLAAGSNAGTNTPEVVVRFYRTNSEFGAIGFDSDTASYAGIAKTNADLFIRVGGTTRGFIDASDSGSIIWSSNIKTAGYLSSGLAGTATGTVRILGTTSGTVTLSVADAAGTWTMKLPAAVGTAGFQLTDAAGDGITSWAAAASRKKYKIIGDRVTPEEGLQKIVHIAEVRKFKYKQGMGTGDTKTEYVGIMTDDVPWAGHYGGEVLNPVSLHGNTILAIQALNKRIVELENELVSLRKAA